MAVYSLNQEKEGQMDLTRPTSVTVYFWYEGCWKFLLQKQQYPISRMEKGPLTVRAAGRMVHIASVTQVHKTQP